MQIIPVCLSIVARRKGVSATRRGGLNWTPISLLVGHPCKLFHTEFGLEGLECGFQFSQPLVSTNRLLNAPFRVAGAQDIVTRSGIERVRRRIALPGHGAGLAIRSLRDGDIIVVVDQGVPFPPPSKLIENLVVVLGAARLAQPVAQVSKIGFKAFTLLRIAVGNRVAPVPPHRSGRAR